MLSFYRQNFQEYSMTLIIGNNVGYVVIFKCNTLDWDSLISKSQILKYQKMQLTLEARKHILASKNIISAETTMWQTIQTFYVVLNKFVAALCVQLYVRLNKTGDAKKGINGAKCGDELVTIKQPDKAIKRVWCRGCGIRSLTGAVD